jgi:5S rRNA maturation endonuclease (ribonuclease M5)
MEKFGIKVTRGYVKRLVKELCEGAGVTRESMGIFAGVRAELYFNGNWTSVSFDNVKRLAEKGTDIIFVEKEGIPEVPTGWADKYGIAMVNTRGHLTEYGKDLMKVAKESGAHVVIMADYDATGVKIASESPTDMPWIGANDTMLEYFYLDRYKLKIKSETSANKEYVRSLVGTGEHSDGRKDERFKDVDVDFLDEERVELDAILANIGDERFFQYVTDTLKDLYPKRDYNRAIEIPSYRLHARHEESIDMIDDQVMHIISDESDKIREELREVLGFIDVNEKYDEIEEKLRKKLRNNPVYEDFADKLNELVESHPFFSRNTTSQME